MSRRMSASGLNKSQALVQSAGPLAANRAKVLSQQLQEAIQSFALQPKAACKGSLGIWLSNCQDKTHLKKVTCWTDSSPEWLDILWALVQEKRPSSAGDGKPEGNEVPWVHMLEAIITGQSFKFLGICTVILKVSKCALQIEWEPSRNHHLPFTCKYIDTHTQMHL